MRSLDFLFEDAKSKNLKIKKTFSVDIELKLGVLFQGITLILRHPLGTKKSFEKVVKSGFKKSEKN